MTGRFFQAWLVICSLLYMLAATVPALSSETLQMAADSWCPYTCDPKSDRPGFLVEILRAALAPDDIAIDYKLMPWERALTETLLGRLDGVVGIDHSDSADPAVLFTTVPVGFAQEVIALRHDEENRYKSLEDLNNLSIGVVQGYHYTPEIDRWVQENKRLDRRVQIMHGENAVELNLQKLLVGRVDAVVEARSVLDYLLAAMPAETKPVFVTLEHGTYLYYGISTKRADRARIAGLIDSGVVRLRQSGELAVILRRYGLTDWDPSGHLPPTPPVTP